MLKPKKIDTKKMIMYFIIMLIMFGGSIFFLYKNYKLTVGSKLQESRDLFEKEEADKLSIVGNDEEVGDAKDGDILDVDIFSDPKYSSLKDNTPPKTSKILIGKPNPFEAQQ